MSLYISLSTIVVNLKVYIVSQIRWHITISEATLEAAKKRGGYIKISVKDKVAITVNTVHNNDDM